MIKLKRVNKKTNDILFINNYINKHMEIWEADNQTSWDSDEKLYKIDDAVVADLSKLLSKHPRETIKLIFETIMVITLFTGLNVATVRDPSLFDSTKNKSDEIPFNPVGIDFAEKYGFSNYKLTKKDYELANEILVNTSKYSKNTADFKKLYRGMNLVGFNELNAWVRTDSEHELGDIASATTDIVQAWHFYRANGPFHVLYEIDNPRNRGMSVNSLSVYRNEKEVIISGKWRVTNCWGPCIIPYELDDGDDDTILSEPPDIEFRTSNDWVEVLQTAIYLMSQKGKINDPLVKYKGYLRDHPVRIFVELL